MLAHEKAHTINFITAPTLFGTLDSAAKEGRRTVRGSTAWAIHVAAAAALRGVAPPRRSTADVDGGSGAQRRLSCMPQSKRTLFGSWNHDFLLHPSSVDFLPVHKTLYPSRD